MVYSIITGLFLLAVAGLTLREDFRLSISAHLLSEFLRGVFIAALEAVSLGVAEHFNFTALILLKFMVNFFSLIRDSLLEERADLASELGETYGILLFKTNLYKLDFYTV